ncbi:MAG: fibronectin type III domain-containing protein, partial [Nitrosopumilus sp.]|nr:fibronectin type III domain-containing protein [Nitrosopumilus sp.]
MSVFAYSQFSFADLSFSEEFGTEGTDDDEFDTPTDLAINNAGDKLYVADSENNRIKIYELTGGDNCSSGNDEIINDEVCFDEEFGSAGSSDGRFDIPTDLAVSKDTGDIYVVDSDNNRVQRFQSDGDYDNLEFGSSSSGDEEYLGLPSAIAIDKKTDYIYVADSTTDSISVFDDDGDFQFNFGDTGSNDDEFRDPSGMVIDDSDQILYVADTDNNRIQIFELTDGNNCPSDTEEIVNDEVCFVDDFGSSGSGDGKFDKPAGLAYDEGNDLLYVADTDNNRIQVFEIVSGNTCPSGTEEIINGVCFVEEFGSSGSTDGRFNAPSGLAIDGDNGVLYVADTDNHRIQMLSLPTGSSSSGSSNGSSSSSNDVPDTPKGILASAASPTSIIITWEVPDPDDNDPKITGYKVETREGSGSYTTIVGDTKSTVTSFLHTGLDEGENYRYKVYAINSEGTSSEATTSTVKPGPTQVPSGVTAVPISKNQILLNWIPPTDTFKQSITGYLIEREVIEDVLYDEVTTVGSSTTTYTVSGLETGKTYSYVITANLAVGNTPRSNAASATPETDAEPPTTSSGSVTVPSAPRNLNAVATSSQIQISWTEPSSDGNSDITGYKVEVKKNSDSFSTLESSTTSRSYVDSNVQIDSKYTYRVSAINSVGTSTSSESSATPKSAILKISPMGKFSIDEKKTLSFTVKITDNSIKNVSFSLEQNPPTGAKISSNTGVFTWTPTDSQGGKSYTFDVVVKKDSMTDRQSITITVNDVKLEPVKEPEPTTEPKDLELAPFVDETRDPQSYVDRYNTEASYKKWFDDNYSEYSSIYQAVGLEEPVETPAFVDPNQDPQYYVDRYNTEASYKKWFDDNYPNITIYQAVGLEEPVEIED